MVACPHVCPAALASLAQGRFQGRVEDALEGGGVVHQLGRRAARAPDQLAAAVGADQMQILIVALGAEGALEGADIGDRRVGGQIPVTAFTVRSEFKHGLVPERGRGRRERARLSRR